MLRLDMRRIHHVRLCYLILLDQTMLLLSRNGRSSHTRHDRLISLDLLPLLSRRRSDVRIKKLAWMDDRKILLIETINMDAFVLMDALGLIVLLGRHRCSGLSHSTALVLSLNILTLWQEEAFVLGTFSSM